ncbi:MAG: TonB family protein [Janthinobacterium lividum]
MLSAFCRPLVLAALLFFGLPGRYSWLAPAMGQTPAPPTDDKVYTYVEQMPQVPGGGGQAAIIAAVQQRLVLPAGTVAASNRVFVQFTVGKQGQVEDAAIVKGAGPVADAAVLAAVRQLPIFVPGRQGGQLVRVAFTLPLTLPSGAALPPRPAADEPSPPRREAQTRQQGTAQRRPGEADSTFVRRVLPLSYAGSNDLLAAAWRPSAFGKQLFFSKRGQDTNEYGTDLVMLDPFAANTYALQTFTIFTQGDATDLAAFFFTDVDQDGTKELLALSECSLREGSGRETHYQTLIFRYDGLDKVGRPRYHYDSSRYDYLDELPTVAAVRRALARHQARPKPTPPAPGKPTKKAASPTPASH